MKRMVGMILCALALAGCGAEQTFETVADVQAAPVMAQEQILFLDLPEEAAVQTLESEDQGTLYLCDGYTLTVQTMEAGDLQKTLQSVTGFSKEQLQLLQTQTQWGDRYDCVWTAAGEGEDQVCRLAVLDDGAYHYCLTAMAGASQMDRLSDTWDDLFRSAILVSSAEDLHSGS